MLAIRMQRTGRRGHASFRVVVQDSRKSPLSGKVIDFIGNYDPHTKSTVISKDKAEFYLTHGAHPSERVAVLLQKEGLKLPAWVEKPTKKSRIIRHPEKLRRNRPDEPKQPGKIPEPVEIEESPEPIIETENVEAEAPVETEESASETTEKSTGTEVETTSETPLETAEESTKTDE